MVIKTIDDLVTAIIEEAEDADWNIEYDAPREGYLDGFQSNKAQEDTKYNIKKLILEYLLLDGFNKLKEDIERQQEKNKVTLARVKEELKNILNE